jgi:hypothetical protein
VADKHRGIDTGVLRHATITPVELSFGKGLLIFVSPRGIGAARRATSVAAGATRCARGGVGRTSTHEYRRSEGNDGCKQRHP